MSSALPAAAGARLFMAALTVALLVSCGDDDRKAATATPSPGIFAAPPKTAAPAPLRESSPLPLEPLPRGVAEVLLRMTRADVEQRLGELRCHDNPQGFEVCSETSERSGSLLDLEVYFHDNRVLSLAYNTPPPADVWEYLDKLMRQYGKPSLSGLMEQDNKGRFHEIYGWKDGETLLSVRFVWVEEAPNPRQLTAVAVTVWDRKAYEAWEAATKKDTVEPPPPTKPPEVVPPELT